MPKPYAKFEKPLSELEGKLTIVDQNGTGLTVRACSGLAGYQTTFWTRSASPIPPNSETETGVYTLETTPQTPTSNEQAAMGSRFFAINPNTIKSKDGTKIRAGIGLHYDANHDTAPGSAGCIVVQPRKNAQEKGIDTVSEMLAGIKKAGYEVIPLIVDYSNKPIDTATNTDVAHPAEQETHWGQEPYNKLVKEGLITGKHQMTENVEWGEFATVICRLKDKLKT